MNSRFTTCDGDGLPISDSSSRYFVVKPHDRMDRKGRVAVHLPLARLKSPLCNRQHGLHYALEVKDRINQNIGTKFEKRDFIQQSLCCWNLRFYVRENPRANWLFFRVANVLIDIEANLKSAIKGSLDRCVSIIEDILPRLLRKASLSFDLTPSDPEGTNDCKDRAYSLHPRGPLGFVQVSGKAPSDEVDNHSQCK